MSAQGFTVEKSRKKFRNRAGYYAPRYRYVTDSGATGTWMERKKDATSAGALNVMLAAERASGADLERGRMLNEIGN